MSKFVKHIFKDATCTEEWSELLDGKWPYGEIETKEFKHNYNLYDE